MRARRMLLYAALTLLVPLPALAVTRYEATRGADPAGFAVRVALDRCGLLETRILCKLDVSYQPLAGATTYVAAVTAPDGSVLDGGELGSAGGSIWVAYAGDGSYSVEVSAFGEADEPGGEPKLLDSDRADAGGGDGFEAVAGEGAAEGEEQPEESPAEPEPDDGEEPAEAPLPPCPTSVPEDDPAAAAEGPGDRAAAAEQAEPESPTDAAACADAAG